MGDRERTVHVALVLVRRAGEVEAQRVAVNTCPQPQLQIPLGRLQHVARLPLARAEPGDRCPRTPLRVVQCGGHRLAHRVQPVPAGELRQPRGPRAVRRELGAEVRHPLARSPHPLHDAAQHLAVELAAPHEPRGLEHDALLVEPTRVRGHAARDPAADVRVVRAARRVPGQLTLHVNRRHHGDVREVGPAAVRVVQHPGVALLGVLLAHGLDGGGHRAQVHGDVLGLHGHLAVRVEDGGRGVAALLDIGRVR